MRRSIVGNFYLRLEIKLLLIDYTEKIAGNGPFQSFPDSICTFRDMTKNLVRN
jgi:hypothetical protein